MRWSTRAVRAVTHDFMQRETRGRPWATAADRDVNARMSNGTAKSFSAASNVGEGRAKGAQGHDIARMMYKFCAWLLEVAIAFSFWKS